MFSVAPESFEIWLLSSKLKSIFLLKIFISRKKQTKNVETFSSGEKHTILQSVLKHSRTFYYLNVGDEPIFCIQSAKNYA